MLGFTRRSHVSAKHACLAEMVSPIVCLDFGSHASRMSTNYRAMVAVLGFSCVCVTCTSSMASDTYPGMIRDFHVSEEVCVLSISLFVIGLGIGPLLLGPVSEFIGRAPVLRYGFAAFFLLGFPVAFGTSATRLH